MPRGGRRANAGRKPKLDFMTGWSIGLDCEDIWREHMRTRLERPQRQFIEDDTALQDYWDQVNKIPVGERKQWLASHEAREHSVAIDEELSRLGQGRVVTFRVSAPYGVRRSIIKTLWKRWRARIPHLTESSVERAWKTTRRLEADCRAELADAEADGSLSRRHGPDDPPDDGGSTLV